MKSATDVFIAVRLMLYFLLYYIYDKTSSSMHLCYLFIYSVFWRIGLRYELFPCRRYFNSPHRKWPKLRP